MRIPNIKYADDIKQWDCTTERDGGKWVCARPYCVGGIRVLRRLKLAWYVFTGKYDALAWHGNQ